MHLNTIDIIIKQKQIKAVPLNRDCFFVLLVNHVVLRNLLAILLHTLFPLQ